MVLLYQSHTFHVELGKNVLGIRKCWEFVLNKVKHELTLSVNEIANKAKNKSFSKVLF